LSWSWRGEGFKDAKWAIKREPVGPYDLDPTITPEEVL
jgi:hypothetical protein